MGLFKKTAEEKAAIQEMRAADAALHENTDTEETSEYLRLNAAANEAASKVSFWHGGTKRG
jgi:hypothetical protein